MQQDFWHEAWAKNDEPGWQQTDFNPYLTKHWPAGPEVVFVPLCGRSLDMLWLHQQGHHIVGIDLSVSAIQTFCKQQSIEATCERDGALTVFRAPGWTLYAGDFFKLTGEHLTRVGRVYDRAALIALPEPMRAKYAAHCQAIIPGGTEIFLLTISYDQDLMKGPPFSVTDSEVHELYSGYDIQVLQSQSGADLVGNLKQRGLGTLTDSCFLLQPKAGS